LVLYFTLSAAIPGSPSFGPDFWVPARSPKFQNFQGCGFLFMDENRPSASAVKRRRVAKALLAKQCDTSVLEQEHDLTAKQAVYVEARAMGMPPSKSAHAAGYKRPDFRGPMMESNPNIVAALEIERAKNASFLNFSRKDVLQGIADAIEQAKLMADPQAQISGWREVAKICGYYAPEVKRVELQGSLKHKMHALEALSDEELLELSTNGRLPAVLDAEIVSEDAKARVQSEKIQAEGG
jgi:hypothetical protein